MLMGLLLTGSVKAQSVSLNWQPSPDTNVVGYVIHYGISSHAYTQSVTVGKVTSASISGLAAGSTFYFAATTYDAAGNESDFSNEATFTTTSSAKANPPTPASLNGAGRTGAGHFSFVVSGVPGAQYVVQASTDLVNWVTIQTNAAASTFVDPSAATMGQRFYRTLSL